MNKKIGLVSMLKSFNGLGGIIKYFIALSNFYLTFSIKNIIINNMLLVIAFVAQWNRAEDF